MEIREEIDHLNSVFNEEEMKHYTRVNILILCRWHLVDIKS